MPDSQPRQSDRAEPTVTVVSIPLCDLCLDGAGGECHVPGCALYMKPAPDVEIRSSVQSFGYDALLWEWLDQCAAAGLGARAQLTQRTLDALPPMESRGVMR